MQRYTGGTTSNHMYRVVHHDEEEVNDDKVRQMSRGSGEVVR